MYREQDIPLDIYNMCRKSSSLHTGWVHTFSVIDEPLQPITDDALMQPFTKLIIRIDKLKVW